MKKLLIILLSILIFPTFAKGTEVCVITVSDEAGGSALIETFKDNVPQRHTERAHYHFDNHYGRYQIEPDVYLNYIITGDFEKESDVENCLIIAETLTGSGIINIEGRNYQVNVNMQWNEDEDWTGWIELDEQRIEVDEELAEIVEGIVADTGRPNPRYHLVTECQKDGKTFYRAETESFFDPSFCLPALNLSPGIKNCSSYDKTIISLYDAEYDTKDLGLGRVRLNGNITIEMKTEQVNDPNFVFPVISKLYGTLDAEVFGQTYHAEMDFDIVGHFMTLAESDEFPIFPVNFKEEKRILKINGNFISEEQIPDYMQYIIPLIFLDDEPLWDE